jgi:hypothetical protein
MIDSKYKAACRCIHEKVSLLGVVFLASTGTASAELLMTEDRSEDAYIAYLASLTASPTSQPADFPRQPRASTIGIIGAFGLPHGSGFIGGAGTDVRERTQGGSADGSIAFGVGFGDANESIGAQVVVGLTSVTPAWGDFGAEGNLNVQLFRSLPNMFSGASSAISFGIGNAVAWGGSSDIKPNVFVSGSTVFPLKISTKLTVPVNLTAGLGSAISELERSPGTFFGVGIGLSSYASIGASWVGDEFIAGVNFFPTDRIQIGVSYGDVTHRISDGRVILSVGISFSDLY